MTYKAIPAAGAAGFVVGWAEAGKPYVRAPGSPVFPSSDEADWCAYLTAAGASCSGRPQRLDLPAGCYGGRRD